MADHGEVQYTTADGNDYPAHEGAYASFVQLAFVGSIAVICIVLGLAISSLTSHWLIGSLVVFVLSPVAFIHGMATGSRTSSLAAFALALLAFGASTLG
jgi:hypothetical protein